MQDFAAWLEDQLDGLAAADRLRACPEMAGTSRTCSGRPPPSTTRDLDGLANALKRSAAPRPYSSSWRIRGIVNRGDRGSVRLPEDRRGCPYFEAICEQACAPPFFFAAFFYPDRREDYHAQTITASRAQSHA